MYEQDLSILTYHGPMFCCLHHALDSKFFPIFLFMFLTFSLRSQRERTLKQYYTTNESISLCTFVILHLSPLYFVETLTQGEKRFFIFFCILYRVITSLSHYNIFFIVDKKYLHLTWRQFIKYPNIN